MKAPRPALPTDLPSLVALEQRCFPPPDEKPWSENQLAAELEHEDAVVLVAPTPDDSDGLAGYAIFRGLFDEAELLRVGVDPDRRGRGIGRALVLAGFARLAAAGVVRCHLEVAVDNGPARALYEALGFSVVGGRPGYYRGRDAVLMTCPVGLAATSPETAP